jgi:carboxylesterase
MIRPHDIGCLLIHGFTSSPTEMAELATLLSTQGYTIRAPRLPGHASTPQDLLRVSHHDWVATAEQAFQALRSITQKQIAIGLSMGGTLALHLAAHHAFAGVVALAPALKLPLWAEISVHLLTPFNYIRHKRTGPDVNDGNGKALLDSYNHYPIAAAKSVLRLQRLVRGELHKIKMPLLAIHSRQDHTVPLNNLDYLLARVQSTHVEKMIVDDSYHVLTVDYDREKIFSRITDFIARVTNTPGESNRKESIKISPPIEEAHRSGISSAGFFPPGEIILP